MEEIKLRTRVLDAFIHGAATAVYRATNIESTYLQFRKIIELIAFGSLVANKEAIAKVYQEFSRLWNARRLLRDLEKVNPGFYPQPIVERYDEQRGMNALEPKKEGFLTRDDLIQLYEKCGGILHATNPYSQPIDYGQYETEASTWRDKIVGLLNCHTIRLLDDPNMYLIHMHEEQDGRVHHYIFAPTDPPKGIVP
jgi:hypothetical protein